MARPSSTRVDHGNRSRLGLPVHVEFERVSPACPLDVNVVACIVPLHVATEYSATPAASIT